VNNIDIASTVSSSPVFISLDNNQANTAELEIDPITVTAQHNYFAGVVATVDVQSNQSYLQFHWGGFEDVS